MSHGQGSQPLLSVGSRAIKLAAIAVVLASLYYGKAMLAPLALAVLLSLLLTPPVHFLERYIGRVAAVIVSAVLSIILLSSAGYGLGVKTVELASRLPQYKERIRRKTEHLKKSAGTWVGKTVDAISEITDEFAGQKPVVSANPGDSSTSALRIEPINPVVLTTTILAPLLAPLETAVIVLIFSIYFLIQPDDLRNRLLRLAGKNKIHSTSHAFDEVGRKVSRFLLMQTVINLVYGAMIAAGMTALGFPDGIIWGGLVAIMRFVPYLGTWVAALPPFLILVATTDGWQPAYFLMLLLLMDLLFAFVVEPLVIGGGIGISPLSLLVAAVFWAWLWGPLGLLLSTPLTVCLAVMGKHVSALRFLNVLLTDKPVLNAKVRFYHQLLGANRSGALSLLKNEIQNKSYCQICDDMLLPVLALAKLDLRRGSINGEKASEVRELAAELVSEITENSGPAQNDSVQELPAREAPFSLDGLKCLPEFAVLCIPAKSNADELAAALFARILRTNGLPAHEISADSSAIDVLNLIEERKAAIVCISALPHSATLHARVLFKRIRSRFPNIIILIGLWARTSSLERSRQRIGCAKIDGLVSTFEDGVKYLDGHLPQLIQKYRNEPAAEKGEPAMKGQGFGNRIELQVKPPLTNPA